MRMARFSVISDVDFYDVGLWTTWVYTGREETVWYHIERVRLPSKINR